MALVEWEEAKFKDFSIKFESFIFTNGKISKDFLRHIKISENPKISKRLGVMAAPDFLKLYDCASYATGPVFEQLYG